MTSDRNIGWALDGAAEGFVGTSERRRVPEEGRRIMVIYNPAAGFGRQRRFSRVLRHLATAGCPVTVRETAGRGEAERLAHAALSGECDVLVSAGGDGTLNEVANAVAGTGLPVGIIPLGTANVMAAEIGLGTDAARIARTLASGEARHVHLGEVGERLFCAMAGVGLDARIVAGVDLGLKRRTGKFAYAWGCLKELARPSQTNYRFTVDGEVKRAAWAIFANGRFYAGRFVAAPQARLDDPALHLVLLTRTGRWNLLRYGMGLLSGRLAGLSDVEMIRTRNFTVDGPEGEPIQADGDIVGRLPGSVSIADKRLTLLHPR